MISILSINVHRGNLKYSFTKDCKAMLFRHRLFSLVVLSAVDKV